ncbi:50S ribosomal protein L24 [Candidatus Pacearchaeota archaeon]|nr:50S ribosomal protein L24 [Candidatus Pacearchaeota archaeon]MBI2057019.1 50S ribosomal protein L24 [Candidatus Pacearchaeota archaeon]
MKNKFSTKWKASKQPRKQRKYLANAPLHLRKNFVNVNLSKELRKKQNKRNIQARKGDKVKIMRGKFRGQMGKILEVNIKSSLVIMEGIQAKKRDGSKVNIKLQPSNLQIIELSDRAKEIQAEKKPETKPAETKSSKNKKTDAEVKK